MKERTKLNIAKWRLPVLMAVLVGLLVYELATDSRDKGFAGSVIGTAFVFFVGGVFAYFKSLFTDIYRDIVRRPPKT